MPLEVNVHVFVHQDEPVQLKQLIAGVSAKLDTVLQQQEKILMTQQEEKTLLTKVDDATTKIGANVTAIAQTTQTIATVGGTISSELDDLIAKLSAVQNVPPEIATQLQALSDKTDTLTTAAQAATDALNAQVPALQAIATKGATNPVPVPPPPPPPPPPAS